MLYISVPWHNLESIPHSSQPQFSSGHHRNLGSDCLLLRTIISLDISYSPLFTLKAVALNAIRASSDPLFLNYSDNQFLPYLSNIELALIIIVFSLTFHRTIHTTKYHGSNRAMHLLATQGESVVE